MRSYGLPDDIDELADADYSDFVAVIREWEQEYREADTDDWIAPEMWWLNRVSKLRLTIENKLLVESYTEDR